MPPTKPNPIHTTGDLRKFLADMLDKVERGQVDHATAHTATKIAAQINNSFYAEAKAAVAQWHLGKQVQEIGHMPLNPLDPKLIK